MNNFTATHKQLTRKEPILIHINDIATQNRQKKSPNTSQSSQNDISPRRMESFRSQMQEFPEIFTKRKREDYSGYKQYNLNKSKLVCLGQTRRQKQPKYPSRKYEVNLKNIIKLKKRYSLQPTHFKSLYKDKKILVKENQLRNNLQQKSVFNQTSQQLKLRQLMKNILLHHNLQQRIPVYYTNHTSECTSQRQFEQNTTDFERYKSQLYTESNERSLDNKIQNSHDSFKISLQKVEHSYQDSRKKPKMLFRTEQDRKYNNNEMEKQLCGWQNGTFYDMKNKSVLQQKLMINKTKLQEQ